MLITITYLLLSLTFSNSGIYPVPSLQYQSLVNSRTVSDVLQSYRSKAEKRLIPHFARTNIQFPPKAIALLAFKQEKHLELWASNENEWQLIKTYAIKGASGHAGPKLLEGDLQVPEGLYKISGLNPNSAFHLSMKLNYPNTFDIVKSKLDGRDNLGGDIFIHGRSDSVGCLAMGDRTIEELFVLTALVGEDNVEVIIAPTDFRDAAQRQRNRPRLQWLPELYSNIKQALTRFKND